MNIDSSHFRWRPMTTGLLLGGVLLVIAAATISYMTTTFRPKTEVVIGSVPFKLTIADMAADREKGLSGVEDLRKGDGLLMVFEQEGMHAIWMKDMKIPIDIIWLNSNREIIYLVQNADPSLGADVVYTPRKPARYVIEVPGGTIKQQALRIGHSLEFDEENVSLWW